MRESLAVFMTVAVIAIMWIEWPKMREKKGIERAAFIALLVVSFALSLTDLPNMYGPPAILTAIFKPLRFIVE